MYLTNEQLNNELYRIVNIIYEREPATAPLFEVMFACGVRASESIKRELWKFESNEIIILQPQKYNDKRIFHISEIPSKYINYLQNKDLINYTVNYSRLNYLFRQATIYPSIYIGEKKSALHLFRHNYVKKLLQLNRTNEEIKDKLGERQMKSVLAYVNSKFEIR